MTIKAIETRYAGCKFRSRLEARYAVLFDTLGLHWEYEPQGFIVNKRPYLPDFYLPDTDTWVEVKGDEGDLDTKLMSAAATTLPVKDRFTECPRLLILGPIVLPTKRRALGLDDAQIFHQTCHTALAVIRGVTCRGLVEFHPSDHGGICCCRTPDMLPLSDDGDPVFWDHGEFIVRRLGWVTGGVIYVDRPDRRDVEIGHAYLHAKSARFEHGQGGKW